MSRLHPPVNANDHSLGPDDARLTLVEYGDYQCPYCGEAYGIVKDLQQRHGDLRLVFRNFPIPELHPQAIPAATTAEYCATQGKFWEAHDALYENQDQLGEELYVQIVRQLGLDPQGLAEAMQSPQIAQRIQDDIDSGLRSGVNGTPSFYVNDEKSDLPIQELAPQIDNALG